MVGTRRVKFFALASGPRPAPWDNDPARPPRRTAALGRSPTCPGWRLAQASAPSRRSARAALGVVQSIGSVLGAMSKSRTRQNAAFTSVRRQFGFGPRIAVASGVPVSRFDVARADQHGGRPSSPSWPRQLHLAKAAGWQLQALWRRHHRRIGAGTKPAKTTACRALRNPPRESEFAASSYPSSPDAQAERDLP